MARQETGWFAGRSAELDQVLNLVAGLRVGAVPKKCLFNIFGVNGIGKSAFLRALAQRLAGEPGLRTITLTLPPLPPSQKAPTLELKQAVLRQLAGADPASWADPLTDAAADEAIATLAAQLVERGTPVMLLIESEARSAPATFGWLERGLLLPLVRGERAGAVITSRSPLRWREFDTRRRTETVTFAPLGLAETAAQLGLGEAAAAAVQRLTAGLPLANELARTILTEQPDPLAWDDATQAELSRRVVAAIYERVEPGLTPDLRCALEVLSVVREFAMPLLQSLLTYCDEHSQARSQDFQLFIIRQLQELNLVRWDQNGLAYRVAPALRPLFAETLRRTDAGRYKAIQRTASTYYRRMLDEVLISRHVHVVELLWHTITSEEGQDTPPVELLRELVRGYLASPDGRHIDQEALAALRAHLAATPDLPDLLRQRGSSIDELIAALDEAAGGA